MVVVEDVGHAVKPAIGWVRKDGEQLIMMMALVSKN